MAVSPEWWKEGVIYQVYPRSFKDSNGDGVGDLNGIIAKLDYIKSLNVDIIWLSPIFDSPNDDNGYDVRDYRSIMEEFGTMHDFDRLLEGVKARDLRLILDLVPNHSSDEHEWFQTGLKDPSHPFRDYYHWQPANESGGPPNQWRSFFGGSAWQKDEKSGEYYLHLFTRKQPDLNWENPDLRREMFEIVRFWLAKGIDGFRIDVIPLISKQPGYPDPYQGEFNPTVLDVYAKGPRLHEYIAELRREAFAPFEGMMLGEAIGVSSDDIADFTATDRKELDLLYHFDHLFLGSSDGGRYEPVPWTLPEFKAIYQKWFDATEEEGWVSTCLGNHDFARIVSRFGNDSKEYHKYSAKLLILLLASQRGTLTLYQGDEIGMTNVHFDSIEAYNDPDTLGYYREHAPGLDDAQLAELLERLRPNSRDNARTPMQWSATKNGGFSDGKPWLQVNPNFEEINVEQQEGDPDSILHFYRKVLSFRRTHPTLVYGNYTDLEPSHEQLFIYRRMDQEGDFLTLLNFSNSPQLLADEIREQAGRGEMVLSNYGDHQEGQMRPWEALLIQLA